MFERWSLARGSRPRTVRSPLELRIHAVLNHCFRSEEDQGMKLRENNEVFFLVRSGQPNCQLLRVVFASE